MQFIFSLLFTVGLLIISSPYVVLAVLPMGLLYYKIAGYYRVAARELQRLDSISKSPIYAAFSEARVIASHGIAWHRMA